MIITDLGRSVTRHDFKSRSQNAFWVITFTLA